MAVLDKAMCTQARRLSCPWLVIKLRITSTHWNNLGWIAPQNTGFLLRNVPPPSLKSFDGSSMISSDRQISASHKSGMWEGPRAYTARGHSCNAAKQETSVMATSCIIMLFVGRNFKCLYAQLPEPHPFVVSRGFLGPSPDTVIRIIMYTEWGAHLDTHCIILLTA